MNSNHTRQDSFAKLIREMGKRGESAYPVDGVTTHDIRAEACTGRTGDRERAFSGTINLATGTIIMKCAEDPSFHLTIELGECPFWSAAPGGDEAVAAAKDFADNASRKREREADPTTEDPAIELDPHTLEEPAKGDRVKLIRGNLSGSIGLLIGIDQQDGIVKMENGDIRIIPMDHCAKIDNDKADNASRKRPCMASGWENQHKALRSDATLPEDAIGLRVWRPMFDDILTGKIVSEHRQKGLVTVYDVEWDNGITDCKLWYGKHFDLL